MKVKIRLLDKHKTITAEVAEMELFDSETMHITLHGSRITSARFKGV